MNLKSFFLGQYSVRMEAKIVPKTVYGIKGEVVKYFVDVNGRAKEFNEYKKADLYFEDMVELSTVERAVNTVH